MSTPVIQTPDAAHEAKRKAVIAAMSPHGWLGEQCVTDILAALDTRVCDAVPDKPSRIDTIESAIRIGVYNTCRERGMSDDSAIAIVRGTMKQLCVASALAKAKDDRA